MTDLGESLRRILSEYRDRLRSRYETVRGKPMSEEAADLWRRHDVPIQTADDWRWHTWRGAIVVLAASPPFLTPCDNPEGMRYDMHFFEPFVPLSLN